MGRPLSYRPPQRTACGEYTLCRAGHCHSPALSAAWNCSAKAAHIC